MKTMMKFGLVAMAALALAVAGCGGDDDDSGEGSGGLGGGTYTFTIESVDDGCYDGAMQTLIMPDLPDKPTIEKVVLPAGGTAGTIPLINFNDPFPDAENIKVVGQGDNGLKAEPAIPLPQTNISAGGTGDCKADITIDANFTFSTDDALAGSATMNITLPDAKDDCPELSGGDTCSITIVISGAKE